MSTITLNPSQSTYVSYGAQNNNYNDNDKLRTGVQSSTSIQYQALVQFDMSSILSYSQINSATLKLYSYSDSCYSAETTILARRITGSWSAGTVTYATRPATTTTSQSSLTASGYNTWYQWNVKDIVQAWVNGTANCGFYMIQSGTSTSKGKCFKKSGTYTPQLYIDYTPLNMWAYYGGWRKAKELHAYYGGWRQAKTGSGAYYGGWRNFM